MFASGISIVGILIAFENVSQGHLVQHGNVSHGNVSNAQQVIHGNVSCGNISQGNRSNGKQSEERKLSLDPTILLYEGNGATQDIVCVFPATHSTSTK